VYSFVGPIDESVQFPAVTSAGGELVIDLNDVTYINSIGIKTWIQWITPVAETAKIELRRCPKSIIFQINMVKNFLPDNGRVSSFYLPLFCEECDREGAALLQVDRDIQVEGENVKVTADLKAAMGCDKPTCQVEVDVIEKKYFRFVQR
jgi:hypothetical protein